MRVVVKAPPAAVVSWEEACAHLRLEADDPQQPYVEGLIAAATGMLDGPLGWLGRAIGIQTLEASFDRFPGYGECLRLPCRPIKTISSVQYRDAAGALQTWAADQYELLGADVLALPGIACPATASRQGAVSVTYVAGYDAVPAPIRTAILLMVGDLFANRETVVPTANATAVPMPTTVDAILAPYRVYR